MKAKSISAAIQKIGFPFVGVKIFNLNVGLFFRSLWPLGLYVLTN